MGEKPLIDTGKCNGCGLCVGVCHCNALAMVNKRVALNSGSDCDWCTDCEAVCTTGAITCPFEITVQ